MFQTHDFLGGVRFGMNNEVFILLYLWAGFLEVFHSLLWEFNFLLLGCWRTESFGIRAEPWSRVFLWSKAALTLSFHMCLTYVSSKLWQRAQSGIVPAPCDWSSGPHCTGGNSCWLNSATLHIWNGGNCVSCALLHLIIASIGSQHPCHLNWVNDAPIAPKEVCGHGICSHSNVWSCAGANVLRITVASFCRCQDFLSVLFQCRDVSRFCSSWWLMVRERKLFYQFVLNLFSLRFPAVMVFPVLVSLYILASFPFYYWSRNPIYMFLSLVLRSQGLQFCPLGVSFVSPRVSRCMEGNIFAPCLLHVRDKICGQLRKLVGLPNSHSGRNIHEHRKSVDGFPPQPHCHCHCLHCALLKLPFIVTSWERGFYLWLGFSCLGLCCHKFHWPLEYPTSPYSISNCVDTSEVDWIYFPPLQE